MIKYFCDRCGKELKQGNPDRTVLFITTRVEHYGPLRDTSKETHRILCNNCLHAFEGWMKGSANEKVSSDAV